MAKMLINGALHEKPTSGDGRFRRMGSGFGNRIEPGADATFPAEAGRYHLYVSMACPWCHRATLMLVVKRLGSLITTTRMAPVTSEDGWVIDQTTFDEKAGVPRDDHMYQVYLRADPTHTGPVTVPVLLDKKTGSIVSNDSADIMRMLNSAFEKIAEPSADYYPQALRSEIDRINELIHGPINSGVYSAGFATTQQAYDEAVHALFSTLDLLDRLLGTRAYLAGGQITEADWRLFTTLIRFDAVYVTHFRTDRKRIADYPNLRPYLRRLFQVPGIAATIDIDHIRKHYFQSHRHINPTGIVPSGPLSDFTARNGRNETASYLNDTNRKDNHAPA